MISSLIYQLIFLLCSLILTLKSLHVKSTPRTNGNNPVFAMFTANYLRKNISISVYFLTAQNTRRILTFFFFPIPCIMEMPPSFTIVTYYRFFYMYQILYIKQQKQYFSHNFYYK